jgi:hypothetical protein
MTAYYEEIMELWKGEKFSDAISYFNQWMSKGFLGQKEIENFNRCLAEFWELVELESQKNAEVLFILYEMVKEARNWDDEMLCKKLEISNKTIKSIKNRHKPRAEGVGLKMLYELFRHMAV